MEIIIFICSFHIYKCRKKRPLPDYRERSFFVYTNAEVELEHMSKTIKWKRIEEQYALWNWLTYISGASKSCYDKWWCNLN